MGFLRYGTNPLPLYEGFVASRARLVTFSNTTPKQIMSRSAHFATGTLTSIKLAFSNFLANAAGDTGIGAATTITASIEYPSGTVTQILFSGSASASIPDIGVVISDYVSVAIPNGSLFWVRSFITNATGLIYNQWQNTFLGEQQKWAASGLTDQTMSGASLSGGSNLNGSYPPLAIIGRTTNASVLIIGDSRASGFTSDTEDSSASNTGFNAKVGNIARSMGSTPFCNISCGGEDAHTFIANSPNTRAKMLPFGSQVILAYGINDLSGGQTPAQIVANNQIIWAAASAPKKSVITIEPHSTSTDSFATTTNQTDIVGTARKTYNGLVRAGIAGGTSFYEVADVMESARDSGLWVVSPTPPYSGDGLHANAAGYLLLQNSGAVSPLSYP